MNDEQLKQHISTNAESIDQGFKDYYELNEEELQTFKENRFTIIRLLQKRKKAVEEDKVIKNIIEELDSSKIEVPLFEGTTKEKLEQMKRWTSVFQPSRSFTLQEIGTAVGLTRERVRQIEAIGLKKLRHNKNMKVFNECKS
jgi:DNA-directed RNA polymerase sigma subunit (sigma70/sigma32)